MSARFLLGATAELVRILILFNPKPERRKETMRRLPVYLLVDVSGSMHGEPIESVKNGLQLLVAALRKDPQALETAYLSVITFGSSAQQIVPLTELSAFNMPEISAIRHRHFLALLTIFWILPRLKPVKWKLLRFPIICGIFCITLLI